MKLSPAEHQKKNVPAKSETERNCIGGGQNGRHFFLFGTLALWIHRFLTQFWSDLWCEAVSVELEASVT